MEELKNEKFENQIKEIVRQFKTEPKNLDKSYDLYFKKHKDSLIEFRNYPENIKNSKFTNMFAAFLAENINEHINYLWDLYYNIFIFLFYDIFSEIKKVNNSYDNILNIYFKDLKKISPDKNEINNTINILIQLNGLNNTQNTYQIFTFLLNVIKNEKEISYREEMDKEFFEKYGDPFSINNKIIWTLYDEDSNENKKAILEGKMTEKEKFNFDIFDIISEIKVKEDIKGINGALFESIFYNKTVLIINIDYLKKNNTTLEQIQNEIKIFQESCPLGYNNLDTYVQIENKVINLDMSYDLFIQALKDKKIIEETKTKICENKINNEKLQKNNDNFNTGELDELRLQLIDEKDKNKNLEEKIKKLEKELIEEKNKNKISEESDLRKDLDNEIKKNNDLKKQIEEKKPLERI